jgi:hypothetical protein
LTKRFFSRIFWITLFFKQNKYHKYGVLLHTLKVCYKVLKDKKYKYFNVALFHDIGKPFVAHQDKEDIKTHEYSFTNHEEISYHIIKDWFFLSNWTKNMVRYHYIIRDLQKAKEKNNLKKLKRLEKIWAKLDNNFKNDLKVFLKYDDFGKQ